MVAVCLLFSLVGLAAASVTDVSGHWAQGYIEKWTGSGLANGYPDGTFQPDNQISRAEFVTLVNKAFNKQNTNATCDFPDVATSDWYYLQVASGKAAGYISGYPDGSFGPGNHISRQEVASIIVKLKGLSANSDDAIQSLTDAGDFPAWSRSSINAVVAGQIMRGYPDGTFKAENFITRAEAIVTLDKALETVPAPSQVTPVAFEGIKGTVLKDGLVVSGASVKLFAKDGYEVLKEYTTNSEGKYEFAVASGEYDLTAAQEDCLGYASGVTVTKDTTRDISLVKGVKASGTIVDSSNHPFKDVNAVFTTNPTFITTTDGSGKFSLYLLPKHNYSLRSFIPGETSQGLKDIALDLEIGDTDKYLGILKANFSIGTTAGGGGGGGGGPSVVKYSVTFDLNYDGATGQPEPQSIASGSLVSEPDVPTRNGYLFGGWYIDALCTTAFDFSTQTIIQNTTLFAKWTDISTTYTLNFDLNSDNATGQPEPQIIAAGSLATEPQDPIRDGYIFIGWYTTSECYMPFSFEDDIITADTTLYACWVTTDQDLINIDNDYLDLAIGYAEGDYAESVTKDVILPLTGENNTVITWSSDNTDRISNTGVVTRPEDESVEVVLTATITSGEKSDTKEFTLKVIKTHQPDINDIVDNGLDELIALNNGEEPEIVIGEDNIPIFMSGCFSDIVIESPEEAILSIYSIKTAMQMNDPKSELTWDNTISDEYGATYMFRQMYNGIPVYGREISVSTDAYGKTSSLSSGYKPNISVDTNPQISEAEAGVAAANYIGGTVSATSSGLTIYSLDGIEPTLAWNILVEGEDIDENTVSYNVIVNAVSGEAINKYSNIFNLNVYETDALGSGNDALPPGNFRVFGITVCSDLWSNISFEMKDRTYKISTYDFNNNNSKIFKNTDNKWTDSASVSAHYNAAAAWRYYNDVLGWKSVDGNGKTIKLYVHVKEKNKDSGSWVNYNNAAWNTGTNTIKFGGEDNTSFKQTAAAGLDVVGHEFTHGVVQYKTKLSKCYQNIPGAINEGYADIFGYFIEGDNDDEWLHNEDNARFARADRNMSNPGEFGYASSVGDVNYINPVANPDDTNDFGGVHWNSTIVSHAAFLMYDKGIRNKTRLAKLWFKSLHGYDAKSDWNSVRDHVVQAAKDMNMTAAEKGIIDSAFSEVNIGRISDGIMSGKIYASADSTSGSEAIADVEITLTPTSNLLRGITVWSDAEGNYSTGEISNGLYNVSFEKDGFRIFVKQVRISGTNTVEDIYLDYVGNNSLSGKIAIADEDTNLSNNLALAGATVSLVKITGSESIHADTVTAENGTYNFDSLPAGVYVITVSKEGYINTEESITIKRDQVNYYNAVIEAIPVTFSGEGTASGTIYDALTGYGATGLTLNIRAGMNNYSGDGVLTTVYTDEDGRYQTPALEAGHYCVEIVDERDLEDEDARYITNYFNIKILGDRNIPGQNGTVSSSLTIDQLRIVLQWGELPRDLDSHLVGPTSNGGTFHIYFSNKTYMESDVKIADLDLDDVTSYGPETTTIYNPIDGTYTFYVHNYSGSPEISTSGAYVQVYNGTSSVPFYVFNVPQGSGRYWTVFRYNSTTQTITPINTIASQPVIEESLNGLRSSTAGVILDLMNEGAENKVGEEDIENVSDIAGNDTRNEVTEEGTDGVSGIAEEGTEEKVIGKGTNDVSGSVEKDTPDKTGQID
jgi:uncharacterized repeat protein (TIGR02543 family)